MDRAGNGFLRQRERPDIQGSLTICRLDRHPYRLARLLITDPLHNRQRGMPGAQQMDAILKICAISYRAACQSFVRHPQVR